MMSSRRFFDSVLLVFSLAIYIFGRIMSAFYLGFIAHAIFAQLLGIGPRARIFLSCNAITVSLSIVVSSIDLKRILLSIGIYIQYLLSHVLAFFLAI